MDSTLQRLCAVCAAIARLLFYLCQMHISHVIIVEDFTLTFGLFTSNLHQLHVTWATMQHAGRHTVVST